MLLNVCPQGVEGKGEGAPFPVKIASEVNHRSEYLFLQHEFTLCTYRVHRLRIFKLFHHLGFCTKSTLENNLGHGRVCVGLTAGWGVCGWWEGYRRLARTATLKQMDASSPAKLCSRAKILLVPRGENLEENNQSGSGWELDKDGVFIAPPPYPPPPPAPAGAGEGEGWRRAGGSSRRALSGSRGC